MARKLNQPRRSSPQLDRLGTKEVFSYHSSGRSGGGATTRRFDQFRDTVPRHRLNLRWQQVPVMIATMAMVLCLAYISTLSSLPRVVFVDGQQRSLLRAKSVYETAAQEVLGASWLNHSKITVNAAQFSEEMKQRFPELSTAALTIPLMDRRPVVELATAQPVLSLTSTNGVFLIDHTGRALVSDKDIKDIGSWKVPQVIDESSVVPRAGQGILPQQTVAFITTFTAQLQARHLQIAELRLPSQASELQIKLTGLNYIIKTSTRSDPRLAAGTYLALKQKLDTDHVTPKEYVDVRVEEKVYYK